MKIVKCDRCGKDIPQYSPMANAVTANIYPVVKMSIKNQWFAWPAEIDLCHDCSVAIANFVNMKIDETASMKEG